MNFGIVIPKVSMNFGIRLFFLINLKSATKPFNVLLDVVLSLLVSTNRAMRRPSECGTSGRLAPRFLLYIRMP